MLFRFPQNRNMGLGRGPQTHTHTHTQLYTYTHQSQCSISPHYSHLIFTIVSFSLIPSLTALFLFPSFLTFSLSLSLSLSLSSVPVYDFINPSFPSPSLHVYLFIFPSLSVLSLPLSLRLFDLPYESLAGSVGQACETGVCVCFP